LNQEQCSSESNPYLSQASNIVKLSHLLEQVQVKYPFSVKKRILRMTNLLPDVMYLSICKLPLFIVNFYSKDLIPIKRQIVMVSLRKPLANKNDYH
jgi:hypothetical protein